MTVIKEPRRVRMQKRRALALKLRGKGYSFKEIGEMLEPKITKQAVQKLIERAREGGA